MVTELMNRCCHVIRRIEVSYILSEGTAAGLGELFSAHPFWFSLHPGSFPVSQLLYSCHLKHDYLIVIAMISFFPFMKYPAAWTSGCLRQAVLSDRRSRKFETAKRPKRAGTIRILFQKRRKCPYAKIREKFQSEGNRVLFQRKRVVPVCKNKGEISSGGYLGFASEQEKSVRLQK